MKASAFDAFAKKVEDFLAKADKDKAYVMRNPYDPYAGGRLVIFFATHEDHASDLSMRAYPLGWFLGGSWSRVSTQSGWYAFRAQCSAATIRKQFAAWKKGKTLPLPPITEL